MYRRMLCCLVLATKHCTEQYLNMPLRVELLPSFHGVLVSLFLCQTLSLRFLPLQIVRPLNLTRVAARLGPSNVTSRVESLLGPNCYDASPYLT